MVTHLCPENILGICDYRTKTIVLNAPRKNIIANPGELERLAALGEDYLNTALFFDSEKIQRYLAEIRAVNLGSEEHPFYGETIYGFAGVIGGLEIYGGQMCDGPRYVTVFDRQEKVFGYSCTGLEEDQPVNPRITLYKPGGWERNVGEWAEVATAILSRKILTRPSWS